MTRADSVTVNYLLEQGCHTSLEYIQRIENGTSLELAARINDLKAAGATLDILLHHGADMNAPRATYRSGWRYNSNKDEEDERHLDFCPAAR